MKQGTVELIIYFYIFVCLVFLLFNIIYIFYDKYVDRRNKRNIEKYKRYIANDRFNERELRDFHSLYSFYYALKDSESQRNAYLLEHKDGIIELFKYYIRRDNTEKAFIANMVSDMFGSLKDNYRELPMILVRYLDGSTVYVRENVLMALCTLGSIRGIEIFYDTLNEKGIVHNSKLLSDGLALFNGDRESLASRLFRNYDIYDDYLNISVINLMSLVGDEFKDDLLDAFDKSDNECRHAIMRYFRKYPDRRFEDILIDILKMDDNLSITAAATLSRYPDERVKRELKKSLSSRNWYIRKNSAISLLSMNLDDSEIDELRNSDDRYASEIFNYVLESMVK